MLLYIHTQHIASLKLTSHKPKLRMAASSRSIVVLAALFATAALLTSGASAQLSTGYYKKTCPKVFDTVKSVVKSAIDKEKRMGASLLRLHFHDCFVQVQ